MLTAILLLPAAVRNTQRTPNRPHRLVHLRLNVFLHTVPAEDVAAAPDRSRIILGVLLHADQTFEYFDSSGFSNKLPVFLERGVLFCLQLASQIPRGSFNVELGLKSARMLSIVVCSSGRWRERRSGLIWWWLRPATGRAIGEGILALALQS